MKPKQKFTKVEFDLITDEEIKALYTKADEEGEEVYTLDALKSVEYAQKAYVGKSKALSTVQSLKDALTEKNGEIQTITEAQRKALEDAGEYETLYKTEVSGRAADNENFQTRITGITTRTKETATASAISEIVGDLFTDAAADIIAPFINTKVKAEYDETTGKVTLVPIDPLGNPSGETVEQFKSALRANESYSSFLKGEGNTGGGGGGGAGGGAGGSIPKEWAAAYKTETLNLTIQSEVLKKNPELHKKLSAEYEKEVLSNIGKNRLINASRV